MKIHTYLLTKHLRCLGFEPQPLRGTIDRTCR